MLNHIPPILKGLVAQSGSGDARPVSQRSPWRGHLAVTAYTEWKGNATEDWSAHGTLSLQQLARKKGSSISPSFIIIESTTADQ